MKSLTLFFTLIGSVALAQEPTVTAPDRLTVKEGFKVERLYSVPKAELGSWVVMCKDDKGRLIAGDQYGALYRFSTPAPGATLKEKDIEKIDLDIGHAWGMCYAFDSLYVVVNDKAHKGRGLYRVRDTDGDDKYDKVELLKKFQENGGEHGPHAVIPGPDGKSLYVISGNQTELPEYQTSRVPEIWGEDNLLPRIYGRGFMKGSVAPRGWVCKTDPDGKNWEVVSTGFRNQYDIDFNADGEMFTYDADMEWDLNTPWYRPTRVNHVISGAEFGWRNGSVKWPDYYSDSFGSVVDIGPGSPTGVVFGTGAKFPAKYQKAFFIADWSYGKLYAVHLKPDGSSYKADFEEFIAGQPLPLTDLTVGDDGALYFAVGGAVLLDGFAGPDDFIEALHPAMEVA
ncbi:heme-binding protein, partial [bacterium]|nr:heme-binding protein [bacterium]